MAIGISKVTAINSVDAGYYDVIDTVDPGLILSETAWIVEAGGKPILMRDGDTINKMVNLLIERALTEPIKMLRIHGHGKPGLQAIASGKSTKPAPLVAIGNYNFSKIQSELSRLSGYFSTNGEVHLMGCNVGEGKKGQNLLQSLANLWRVSVTAGVQTQWACSIITPVFGGMDTTSCKYSTFAFEGPTETAFPK